VKKLIALATLVLATLITGAAAQQAPEKPKQDSKAEAKAPAGVAVKWILAVETQNGTMTPAMELKVDGKKVTGTLSSQDGEAAVAGEFADNKLTFSINVQRNGGDMKIDFAGTLKADGTLAGTMAFPQGEIPWTAARPK
jgi:hypothetical protein